MKIIYLTSCFQLLIPTRAPAIRVRTVERAHRYAEATAVGVTLAGLAVNAPGVSVVNHRRHYIFCSQSDAFRETPP